MNTSTSTNLMIPVFPRREVTDALPLIALSIIAFLAMFGRAHAAQQGPCDIYADAGTPCVAAYSSVRALSSSYGGFLYQVKRMSDGSTYNVGLISPGGYAYALGQDQFCANDHCVITKIYDQSGRNNDLSIAGPGAAGPANSGAPADALPTTVAGHHVYGIYLPPHTGYRRSSTITTGVARDGAPETMYEVASGTNVNNGCCSDFGNVETQEIDTGQGHMDTLNVSLLNAPGSSGRGPWVQADLENGVWEGKTAVWPPNTGNSSKFVTALLKNDGQTQFSLKGGNAQSGGLSTWYSGILPPSGNYSPMHQEGSIVLGTGGDNSNRGTQSFYEGVMTAGYSSDSADNAVQQNIISQNYQSVSTGGGPGTTIVGPGGKCVDVYGNDTGGNGSKVQLFDCRRLAADQHWNASAIGNGTFATLGRCMDITGNSTSNGAKIELYDCNGVGGQQWIPQPDGSIKNPQSGKCLDDPSGQTANGTQLQLYTCNGSSAQKFTITDGTPIIGPGNKCVDVAGDDTGGNLAKVQLYDCYSVVTSRPYAKDQHWRIYSDHTIRTLGKCLDIDGNGTANGTKLELYACNGVGGQEWIPRSDGSLFNPQSGRCLDDPSGQTSNGTVLQIYDCNGLAPQRFTFN